MSDTRNAKRKAEELEAVPETEKDINKRAKKGEDEEADGVIEKGESDEEAEVDPDELAALDTSNVIEGGRRTRGVRVDYSKMKFDEEEEPQFRPEDLGENQDEDEDEDDGEDNDGEGNEEESQNIVKEANGQGEEEEEEDEEDEEE